MPTTTQMPTTTSLPTTTPVPTTKAPTSTLSLSQPRAPTIPTKSNSQIDQTLQSVFDSYDKFVADIKVSSKSLPTTDGMNRLSVQAYNVMNLAVTAENLINTTMVNNSKNVSLITSQQFIAIILAVINLMIYVINTQKEIDPSGSFISSISFQTSLTNVVDSVPTVTKVIDDALQILPGNNWIIAVKNMIEEIKVTYTTLLLQIKATTTITSQTTTGINRQTTTQTPQTTTQTPQTTTQTPQTTTQTPQTTTQTPLTADEQAIQVTFYLYNQFVSDLKIRINSPPDTDATSNLSDQHTILRDNAIVTEVLINRALANDSNNTKFIMYKQMITVMLATINFMIEIIRQQYWVAKSDKLYAREGIDWSFTNKIYVQNVLDTIPPVTTVINNALQIIPGNSFITSVQNTIAEIKAVYTMFLSKLSSTTTRISGGRSRKISSKKRKGKCQS
jgi:hypothetical protein